MRKIIVGVLLAVTMAAGLSVAPAASAATEFTNKTTSNGLGNSTVFGVYVDGSTIYAATLGGLSISTDGGSTFANRTTIEGLGSNVVLGVYAVGSTIYAATDGGLSISTNGGSTFTTKTISEGLGDNLVNSVYAVGSTVYAATLNGLSISLAVSASGPTAPLQAYSIIESDTCGLNAPASVNIPGLVNSQFFGWGKSWQQWPNNGTGGYVCVRQPYYTTAGTWAVN